MASTNPASKEAAVTKKISIPMIVSGRLLEPGIKKAPGLPALFRVHRVDGPVILLLS
jgi:hypothetical protein